MNFPGRSSKPSDSDRELIQAELTRLVGAGRLDLDTYQELADIVWSTDDQADLDAIRNRFMGPPRPPQQQPPMQYPPIQQQPPMPPQQYPPQQPPQGFAVGGHVPQPGGPHMPSPPPEQSNLGTIRKSGEWYVPVYSKYKLNGADLHLDLRHATAAGPVITFDITATMSSVNLIVPPGVFVDVQMKNRNWSDFSIETTAPAPNAPRVILTGIARGTTVKVMSKGPDEPVGFWQKLFG